MGNDWLNKGYQLLNDVEIYLWEMMVTSSIGWFSPHSLPPEVLQARSDYVEGRITESELETRMVFDAANFRETFLSTTNTTVTCSSPWLRE